jgi:hypothetical protein
VLDEEIPMFQLKPSPIRRADKVIEYAVDLPSFGSASIRSAGNAWELVVTERGSAPLPRGSFATASDALAALESEERERLIALGVEQARER